jgi:hypothetical protein
MVRQVARCLVHESPGSRGEGANCWSGMMAGSTPIASRTLTLQVRPESFLDELRFASWARRELLHIEDMVDPAFGYAPWLREGRSRPGQPRPRPLSRALGRLD